MSEPTTAELVQLAWDVPPSGHRQLLTQAGASEREVVGEPLGDAVAARLRSADEPVPSEPDTTAGNEALGMWVPSLRLVLINEMHRRYRVPTRPPAKPCSPGSHGTSGATH